MNRKTALKNIATLIGVSAATGLAIGRFNFLTGCTPRKSNSFFSTTEQEIISEIAGIIIPATSTPGAKEAGVPAFIEMMLQECYRIPEQDSFKNGLKDLETKSKALGDDFRSLSQEKKKTVLTQIEDESLKNIRPPVPSFWQLMKELTLLGYFTSEIGMKEAMVYVPVPGRIEAIKINKDQKAYSEYIDRFW